MPINFTMQSFALSNTRSVHNDTNYAVVGLKQNGTSLAPQAKRIGNVNNGTHQVGLTIPISSTYHNTDTFAFGYLVINHGGGKTDAALADCNNAMTATPLLNFNAADAQLVKVGNFTLPRCLSTALRAKDDMNTDWNLIKSQFAHLSSDQCDGPVAIDHFSFTGEALTQMILVSQANPFSIIYLGTDSAIGCGSNSDYSVQWLVSVT